MATVKKKIPPKKRVVKDDHKRALAQGRHEAKVVREYLTYLKENKPKRGRKRPINTVTAQLEAVNAMLQEDIPNQVLVLKTRQRKLDLELELAQMMADKTDPKKLETAFIKVAANYSKRIGITRAAWLSMGGPAHKIGRAHG